MSFIFFIKTDKGFILAADTRESIAAIGIRTDFGEKLFFSVKHRFAMACFNGSTVRHAEYPDDLDKQLFVSFILKQYFEALNSKAEGLKAGDCIEDFWKYIREYFPAYEGNIRSEVCFQFAGFDKDNKPIAARFGALFDEQDKKLEADCGKTHEVAIDWPLYCYPLKFLAYTIDQFYFEICTNKETAKIVPEKDRVIAFLNWADAKGILLKVAEQTKTLGMG